MGVRCATDDLVVPAFPTRKWICENLDLSMKEVRRMDDEDQIARHPGFGKPVKYYGHSVRDFMEGRASVRR